MVFSRCLLLWGLCGTLVALWTMPAETAIRAANHSRAAIVLSPATRPRAKRSKNRKRSSKSGKKKRRKGSKSGKRAKRAEPKSVAPTWAPSAASQVQVGITTFPLVAFEEDAQGNLVRVVCVRETNFGRIIVEAVWHALTDFPPVDMVLINCEEIGANIVGPTITHADIQQALPFNHKLVVMRLTAAQLLAAMEDVVSTKAESPALEHDLQLLGVFVKYVVDRPGLVGLEEVFLPARVKLLQARTGLLSPMVTIVRDFRLVVPSNDTFVVATTKILGVDDGGNFKSLVPGEFLAETNMTTQNALVRYLSEGTGTVSIIDPPTMPPSSKTPTPTAEEGETEIIGTTTSPLVAMELTDDGEAIHLVCERETNLGQLLADAIWYALQPPFVIDIALINCGAIRANIPGPTITRSDVRRALPDNQRLVVMELTGAQLLAAAENAVSDTPNLESSEHGYFLQVGGAFIRFDVRRRSFGGQTEVLVPSRVMSLQVTKTSNADNSQPSMVSVVENFKLVAPNATFVVATTDFLGVEGDHNYSSLAAGTLLAHTNVTTQDALVRYLVGGSGNVNISDPPTNVRMAAAIATDQPASTPSSMPSEHTCGRSRDVTNFFYNDQECFERLATGPLICEDFSHNTGISDADCEGGTASMSTQQLCNGFFLSLLPDIAISAHTLSIRKGSLVGEGQINLGFWSRTVSFRLGCSFGPCAARPLQVGGVSSGQLGQAFANFVGVSIGIVATEPILGVVLFDALGDNSGIAILEVCYSEFD